MLKTKKSENREVIFCTTKINLAHKIFVSDLFRIFLLQL